MDNGKWMGCIEKENKKKKVDDKHQYMKKEELEHHDVYNYAQYTYAPFY